MKVSRWNSHKVNTQKYESTEFGARVEIDTEVDPGYDRMTEEAIADELDRRLDAILAPTAERVVALGGEAEESHVVDFYEMN